MDCELVIWEVKMKCAMPRVVRARASEAVRGEGEVKEEDSG